MRRPFIPLILEIIAIVNSVSTKDQFIICVSLSSKSMLLWWGTNMLWESFLKSIDFDIYLRV